MNQMLTAPSPTIRDATFADAAAIAAIYNVYIDRGDCTMDQVHWTDGQVADRIQNLDAREALIVAEEQGQVLGWGAVRRYSDRLGYRACCETSAYVASEYTSRGIGQALMDDIILRVRQLEYRHLQVRIFAANAGSIRFHEGNGFSTVGTLHQVGYLNGKWIDVVIMERILPEMSPSAG